MCTVSQLCRTEKATTLLFPCATIAFRHEFIFPIRDALSAETMQRFVQKAELVIINRNIHFSPVKDRNRIS